jgi:peptidyl-tRNA hydrolase, PTH1 family
VGSLFLIVGLGNPGPKYEQTRHNAGFCFLDSLLAEIKTTAHNNKFHSKYARAVWNGFDCIFLYPQTFMNVSGVAVLEATQFFKIPPENLIVVCDDLDQEPGAVRMRVGGGHGGNNGLRDILDKCPWDNFHRIKIGIGKPVHKTQTSDWVLGKFSADEWSKLSSESFVVAKDRLLQTLRQVSKK